MKTSFIQRISLAIGITLSTLSAPILAETTDAVSPQSLRGVMQQLGKEMQNITAAISSEEWAKVALSAAWVADHPKPPMSERMRIMGFLGGEMGKFKASDQKTHQAALELAKAATAEDGQAVIAAFAVLQNTCLSCHQGYRLPLQEYLNGK